MIGSDFQLFLLQRLWRGMRPTLLARGMLNHQPLFKLICRHQYASSLIPFINESDSLAPLLQHFQPFWLVQRTARLLVLFAVRELLLLQTLSLDVSS